MAPERPGSDGNGVTPEVPICPTCGLIAEPVADEAGQCAYCSFESYYMPREPEPSDMPALPEDDR